MITLKDKDVTLVSPSKRSTSAVWVSFKLVQYKGEATEYAACVSCNTVVTYKYSKDGKANSSTKDLLKHIADCSKDVSDSSRVPTPLSPEEGEVFKKLALAVCAKELRPFRLFEGEAMRALAQNLIDTGSKHGPLNVKSVSHFYILDDIDEM